MKSIYSAGDTNKLGSYGALEDSMEGNSPEKEGGEVEFADGTTMEYHDRQGIINIMGGVKAWNKDALMTMQNAGLLPKETALRAAGMLDYARAPRASGELEFNNIEFSIDPIESSQLAGNPNRDDILNEIRANFISSVNDFIQAKHPNDDNVKAAYLIVDHFHTDTPNYHMQARISRYSLHVDDDKKPKYISKFDFDLSDTSLQAEFSKYLGERFGERISVSYSGTSKESADANKSYKTQYAQQQVAQQAVEQYASQPIAPDLHKISRAEKEMALQLNEIDQQIRDLMDKRAEKQQAIEDIKSSKTAIEERLKAEQERDSALIDRDEAVQMATEAAAKMTEAEARAEKAESNLNAAVNMASERAVKIEELEESVKQLEESNVELTESVTDLEKTIEELEGEKKKVEAHRDQLQNEKILLEGEVEDLGKQNKTLVDQLSGASLKLEKTHQELDEAKKLNEAYVAELAGVKTQLDKVNIDLKHSQQARESLLNENTGLKETVEGMKKIMEEAKQQNQEALNQMQQMNVQLSESFKVQLQQMQDMMQQSHQMQQQTLLQQIETLKAEKTAADEKAAMAIKEVKAIESVKLAFEPVDNSIEYKAEPQSLINYNAIPFGENVIYENAKGFKSFIDHGNTIEIASKHPNIEDVKAMLELASKKWPDGINVLSEDQDFRYKVVKIAAEYNYKIVNEDLQRSIDAYKEILNDKQKTIDEKTTNDESKNLEGIEAAEKSPLDMTPDEQEAFLKSLDLPEDSKGDSEKSKDNDKDLDR